MVKYYRNPLACRSTLVKQRKKEKFLNRLEFPYETKSVTELDKYFTRSSRSRQIVNKDNENDLLPLKFGCMIMHIAKMSRPMPDCTFVHVTIKIQNVIETSTFKA